MHYSKPLKLLIYLLGSFSIFMSSVSAALPEACFTVEPNTFGNKTEREAFEILVDASCSSGDIQNYQWKEFDGSGSLIKEVFGQKATFSFDNVGGYAIELTVSDRDNHSDLFRRDIFVGESCAKIIDFPTQIIPPNKIPIKVDTCQPVSGSIIEQKWIVKWKKTEPECEPYKPAFDGLAYIKAIKMPPIGKLCSYTIQLNIKDINGSFISSEPISDFLVAKPKPIAVINSPAIVQVSKPVTLDGSGSYSPIDAAITEYNWTVCGDKKAGKTVEVTFEETQKCDITLIVKEGDSESDLVTAKIDVRAPPVAAFNALPSSECELLKVKLDGRESKSPNPGDSIDDKFAWTIVNSGIAPPESTDITTIIIDQENDYTFRLVVKDNNGFESEPVEEEVSVYEVLSISPCRHTYLSEQSGKFFLPPSDDELEKRRSSSAEEVIELEMKEPVVCAVIDSGVDYNHPDLKPYIWTHPNFDEIPDNDIDDDGNSCINDVHGCDFTKNDENDSTKYSGDPMDKCGHGTHVAGILAGLTNESIEAEKNIIFTGIDNPIQIMPLRVIATKITSNGIKCGDAETPTLITALKYVKKMGIKCVNMSLHVSPSDSKKEGLSEKSEKEELEDILQDLVSEGVIMIAASGGNDRKDNDKIDRYPANFEPKPDNLISVCSIDKNNTLSIFSHFGEKNVDLCAFGNKIESTGIGNEYIIYNGTSMATSFVTRAVALIESAYPELTALEIKEHLMASTTRLNLSGNTVTGGSLNFYNAINTLKLRKQTFTVFNNSQDDIFINGITLEDMSEFRIDSDNCSSQNLMSNEQCDIKIFFTPTSIGKKNTSLKVHSDIFTAVAMLSGGSDDTTTSGNGGTDGTGEKQKINTDFIEPPSTFYPDERILKISALDLSALTDSDAKVISVSLLPQIGDEPLYFQCNENCQSSNLGLEIRKKLGKAVYNWPLDGLFTVDTNGSIAAGTIVIPRVQIGTRFYEFNFNVIISRKGYIELELEGDMIPID
jgi:subtilisin family serine protease